MYHVIVCQPNRYYKEIYEQLKDTPNYNYHSTWRLEEASMWKSIYNIWQITPFNYPQPADGSIIYGPFDAKRFDYLANTSKYTIIENPLDRVYQCYKYIEIQRATGCKNNKFLFNILPGDIDNFIDMYIHNHHASLRISTGDVHYITNDDTLNQYKTLAGFKYVGTVDKIEKSIKNINEHTGVELLYNVKMDPLDVEYRYYRRDELEEVLADNLEVYHKINDSI